jgi:hypothetical protein
VRDETRGMMKMGTKNDERAIGLQNEKNVDRTKIK